MPLYICNCRKDVLDASSKREIAERITDTHCAVTDAPAMFVHVAFFEEAAEFPLEDKALFVIGNIRKGRSGHQKHEIASTIRRSLSEVTGVDESMTEALISETPASWVLEGGEIMPEPGEEAAWLAAHQSKQH
ncbi:MAG: tautomerase family protein [Pseudomonadota bacterium]